MESVERITLNQALTKTVLSRPEFKTGPQTRLSDSCTGGVIHGKPDVW